MDACLPAKILSSKTQNALLENYMFSKGYNPFSGVTSRNNDTQKIRKECHQSLPPEGWHKANFDGAEKGNLSAVGSGGVIKNSHGYGIVTIYSPLGHQTNHFFEACATLQMMKMAKEIGVKSLWLKNITNCLRGDHISS